MTHPEVDAYLADLDRWKEALTELRALVLSCGLEEHWKWRQPCYMAKGKNVLILGSFKDSCVLSFFNGSALQDPHGWLVKPGPHTQHGRFIRFTDALTVRERADELRAYVFEAADLAVRGATGAAEGAATPANAAGAAGAVEPSGHSAPPEELTQTFAEDEVYEAAFAALTPGRQRAYLMRPHEKTPRVRRIAPRAGTGLEEAVLKINRAKLPSRATPHPNSKGRSEIGCIGPTHAALQ
jgi:uncharacterized protein YdeI (YjbR/CyaY-like superfamily)